MSKKGHLSLKCYTQLIVFPENVVNDKTNRLLTMSKICNGEMASCTGKCSNRMKSLMKVYEFYGSETVTILHF